MQAIQAPGPAAVVLQETVETPAERGLFAGALEKAAGEAESSEAAEQPLPDTGTEKEETPELLLEAIPIPASLPTVPPLPTPPVSPASSSEQQAAPQEEAPISVPTDGLPPPSPQEDLISGVKAALEQQRPEGHPKAPQETALQETETFSVDMPEAAPATVPSEPSGGSPERGESGLKGENTAFSSQPDIQSAAAPGLAPRTFATDVSRSDSSQLTRAVDTAIYRFAEDLRGAQSDGTKITIVLEPRELGSLSITLTSGKNGLTAKLVTDNQEAASLLSGDMDRYLRELRDKGVGIQSAEVMWNQTEADGHRQDGGSFREGRFSRRSGGRQPSARGAFEAALGLGGSQDSFSQREYQA